MKKIILIFVIGLFCINHLEAKKFFGYYITKSNDTVKVKFNIPVKLLSQEPNYEKLQWKIKYYDTANIKQVLRPSMAKEIGFDFDGETVKMLSCYNDLDLIGSIFIDNSYIFLQLIKDGKLKLFKYYKTNYSPGMYNASTGMTTGGYAYSVEKYVMQKNNGELFKTRWLSFKKDMVGYLSDCPDVAKKVSDKIYRSDDIEEIVDDYNRTCK